MKNISIIIPCYNLGDFVIPMLESLKNSDSKKTEIIIIDDCSTDNTLEIIEKFPEWNKEWKLIKNEKNIGISETRNKGIKEASATYVYFLDGDDTLNKDFEQLENIELGGDFYRFKSKKQKEVPVKKNLLEPVQISSMLFKRTLFNDKKLRFPKGVIFEDNHFLMLLTNELVKKGVKKYTELTLAPFKYTEFREGSITATKHSFNTVVDSFEAMKDMDSIPWIKDFFIYQLWNSFMVNSKRNYDGFILEKDKQKISQYLKSEYKKMNFNFINLPILWKIRIIIFKCFKFVF